MKRAERESRESCRRSNGLRYLAIWIFEPRELHQVADLQILSGFLDFSPRMGSPVRDDVMSQGHQPSESDVPGIIDSS